MYQIFTALKYSFLDPLFQGLNPEETKVVPKDILYMDGCSFTMLFSIKKNREKCTNKGPTNRGLFNTFCYLQNGSLHSH